VTEIGVQAAALAVLLAILSNTVVKSAMSWIIGGWRMGLRVSAASVLAAAGGVAALVFAPSVLRL
jgi:uncharacterized membrane protein (DUF4010 family)